MLHFILCTHITIYFITCSSTQSSTRSGGKVYVFIKPFEIICIEKTASNCNKNPITMKFTYTTSSTHEIENIVGGQPKKTLKNLKLINIFVNKNIQNPKLIVHSVGTDQERIRFQNFRTFKTDDIYEIPDKDYNHIIMTRIRITEQKKYKFLYISINHEILFSTSQSLSTIVPNIDQLAGFTRISDSTPADSLREKRRLPEKKSICTDAKNTCFTNLLQKHAITKSSTRLASNSIDLEKYLFEATFNEESYNLKVTIKYQNEDIPDTQDFTSNSPECGNSCNNYASCSYDEVAGQSGFTNVKCTCNTGRFGVSCEHEYRCGKCKANECTSNTECGQCLAGWKTSTCSQPDCESLNMCGIHGTCDTSQTSQRKCICQNGWELPYCTKKNCHHADLNCGSEHQGTCKLKNDKHICECKPGWTGPRCQTASCDKYNECGQNGYCELTADNNIKCTCFDGWEGEKCQTKKCPSRSTLCKAGVTCSDTTTKRQCPCEPQYGGYDCKKRICDETEKNNCIKHDSEAHCKIKEEDSYCQCSDGVYGELCQYKGCKDVNFCGLHGRCVNENEVSKCKCDPGWTGADCNRHMPCSEYNDCEKGCKYYDN